MTKESPGNENEDSKKAHSPKFIEESFTVPADHADEAWYHARGRALAENKDLIRFLLSQPDKDQVRAQWMQKSDAEVTDDRFFMMIEKDPAYLGSRFAQEKIERWQNEMCGFRIEDLPGDDWREAAVSGPAAFRAEQNLKKIGTTLAHKTTEKPRTDHLVFAVFGSVLEAIKKSGISRMRAPANKKLRFKEVFSKELAEQKDILEQLNIIPNTDRKLAIAVTAALTGHTPSTVNTYLKKKRYKEIMLGVIPVVVDDPSK